MQATLNIGIIVTAPPLSVTNVVYTTVAATFPAPVRKGTALGRITVEPAAWKGSVNISGPDAAMFALTKNADGSVGLSAAQDLSPTFASGETRRQYSATISATDTSV